MVDTRKLPVGVQSDLYKKLIGGTEYTGLTWTKETQQELFDYCKDKDSDWVFNEYCIWKGFIGWGPHLIEVLDTLRDT